MGSWSPEVAPPFLKKNIFFCPCHRAGELRKAPQSTCGSGGLPDCHPLPVVPSLPGLPFGSGTTMPLCSLF
jgi:hypothetical protein